MNGFGLRVQRWQEKSNYISLMGYGISDKICYMALVEIFATSILSDGP
jgi:hypothetical protein